jgi:hypothetical protein
MMFSKNTNERDRQEVLSTLNISTEARNEKYLGLPIYMGQSRTKTFAYLKGQVWKRIQGWKEKLLSKVGKEVLIKVVAQAIPTYAISCFDRTKILCAPWSVAIGGHSRIIITRCTGSHGTPCVRGKIVEVWAFMTYTYLTSPCWLGRHGGWLWRQSPFVPTCFELNITKMVTF